MRLFVRPGAAADVAEAHFWYESQRLGLGDEFIDAILVVLEVLQDSPRRYRVVHRDTRRAAQGTSVPRLSERARPCATSLGGRHAGLFNTRLGG